MADRLGLAGLAIALPLAFALPAAHAATPKDTLVIAKQLDDIITLDPAEGFELSGIEIDTNIYDRLLRYEAEDLTKLVGGVAESWTVATTARLHLQAPPRPEVPAGAPVTAEDIAFSLQRVVLMNKTPAFILTQLGWNQDNVKDLVKAIDPTTLQLKITEDFAPIACAEPDDHHHRLGRREEGGDGAREGRRLRQRLAEGQLGRLRRLPLVSWKANESVTLEANPAFRMGAPATKRVVVRHVPEAAAQRLMLEKGDVDIARDLSPDLLKALAGNKAIKIEAGPARGEHLVHGLNQKVEPSPSRRCARRCAA